MPAAFDISDRKSTIGVKRFPDFTAKSPSSTFRLPPRQPSSAQSTTVIAAAANSSGDQNRACDVGLINTHDTELSKRIHTHRNTGWLTCDRDLLSAPQSRAGRDRREPRSGKLD